jgi:hypothetical protein
MHNQEFMTISPIAKASKGKRNTLHTKSHGVNQIGRYMITKQPQFMSSHTRASTQHAKEMGMSGMIRSDNISDGHGAMLSSFDVHSKTIGRSTGLKDILERTDKP